VAQFVRESAVSARFFARSINATARAATGKRGRPARIRRVLPFSARAGRQAMTPASALQAAARTQWRPISPPASFAP
jgi:hypothetical protein